MKDGGDYVPRRSDAPAVSQGSVDSLVGIRKCSMLHGVLWFELKNDGILTAKRVEKKGKRK